MGSGFRIQGSGFRFPDSQRLGVFIVELKGLNIGALGGILY